MVMLTALLDFLDIPLVSLVALLVHIHLDGNVLNAMVFQQVTDGMLGLVKALPICDTDMDDGIIFQPIHGPDVELVEAGHIVHGYQVLF